MFTRPPVSVRSIEDPQTNLTAEALVAALGMNSSSFTGATITPQNALTGTVAVYACVNLLAGVLGSLPVHLFTRDPDGNKQQVPDSLGSNPAQRFPASLARLVHQSPNPEMTAQEAWELAFTHDLLWGNAYYNVVRGPNGRPTEAWPLRPDYTQPMRDSETGRKFFRTQLPSGRKIDLLPNEVMHVKALSVDGMCGVAPIQVARNAVAIEQAAAEYVGRFYQNSAIPGLLITAPNSLGEGDRRQEKVRFIREQWQDMYGGLKKAHRLAILENGMDAKTIGIPPKDAQFIELRDFQITEIARLFGIPPHMVGQTEKSTSYGQGIEQQAIGFVQFTCTPWLQRFEQAANRDLGSPQIIPGQTPRTLKDEGLFVEFNVDGLLRGDVKSRYEAYALGRQWSWLTRADIRRKENLPVAGDGSDDEYLDAPTSQPAPDQGNNLAAVAAAMGNREVVIRQEFDQPPEVKVEPHITVEPPQIRVEPTVTVEAPQITVEAIHLPKPAKRKRIERDHRGDIVALVEED